MKLAQRAGRGVAVTLAGQWTKFALQLASTMILARLLTPRDYGLVGMVLILVGFAELLKDLGLSAATIQRKTITDAQVNALFWVNVVLGVVIAGALAAAAPAIAAFYGRPELVGVVRGLAAVFVFSGLAAQHQALLNRWMRFNTLAAVEVGSMASGAVLAVAAAWAGAGYWALVVFHVAQPFVRMVLVWQRNEWRPGRPGRAEGLRSLLSFGGHLSAFRTVSFVSLRADHVLIGRYLGAGSLGLYSKAYQLVLQPQRQLQAPLARVAVPTLSRLQDDPDRYRRYFATALTAVAFLIMPLMATVSAAARDVVLVVFGSQWVEATPIFRVLAIAGVPHMLNATTRWLFVSMGRMRQQLLVGVAVYPLYVLAFAAGLPWGAYGVAVAFTLASTASMVPLFVVAMWGTCVGPSDVVRGVWRPALLSVAAYGAASLVQQTLEGQPLVLSLLGTVAAAGAVFGGGLLAWPGAQRQGRELLDVARTSLRRGEGAAEEGRAPAGDDAPAEAPPPAERQ